MPRKISRLGLLVGRISNSNSKDSRHCLTIVKRSAGKISLPSIRGASDIDWEAFDDKVSNENTQSN